MTSNKVSPTMLPLTNNGGGWLPWQPDSTAPDVESAGSSSNAAACVRAPQKSQQTDVALPAPSLFPAGSPAAPE